ncbi:hypothetical protein M9Y10_021708 [Tritrichomonas musculus]|uniref:Amino acid transporter transmembrane domain-containing protein n=1 Tax=Tritrichomonas musculus TaxID=1915356 RepID=A0ABR2KQH0_9EUKA
MHTSNEELEMGSYTPIESTHGEITLPRAVAVLTNVITGIGLLGIPYCFCSGIGTNLLIVITIASFSMFSFSLLIDCASRSGVHDYPKLISTAFVGRNIQWIPDIIIIITLFGVSILYLQFSLSLMTSFFEQIDNIPKILCNRLFLTFAIQFVILTPLVMLKSMHALSFVSIASVVLICIYLFHSFFYFSKSISDNQFDKSRVKIFAFDLKMVIPALSIQSSSFTCHTNIFPTLVQLKNPTKKRSNLTMLLVVVSATLLYVIGGIFPYLTLYDDIKDPVVLNYYQPRVFTNIIKACYSLLLILTAPLLIFTCRLSIQNLTFKSEVSYTKSVIIGIAIALFDCIISVTVKKLNVMFSLVGGVTCPIIVYIFPSLYYLKICTNESKIKTIFSYVSIVVGITFIIICLYDAIRSMI